MRSIDVFWDRRNFKIIVIFMVFLVLLNSFKKKNTNTVNEDRTSPISLSEIFIFNNNYYISKPIFRIRLVPTYYGEILKYPMGWMIG